MEKSKSMFVHVNVRTKAKTGKKRFPGKAGREKSNKTKSEGKKCSTKKNQEKKESFALALQEAVTKFDDAAMAPYLKVLIACLLKGKPSVECKEAAADCMLHGMLNRMDLPLFLM